MTKPKLSNLDSLQNNEVQRVSLLEPQIKMLKEEIKEYDMDFDRRELRVHEDELEQFRNIIRETLYTAQLSKVSITYLECLDLEDFMETYKPHVDLYSQSIKQYEDGPEVLEARTGHGLWTCIRTEEDTELFVNRYVSNELYYIICKIDYKIGARIEVIEFI